MPAVAAVADVIESEKEGPEPNNHAAKLTRVARRLRRVQFAYIKEPKTAQTSP